MKKLFPLFILLFVLTAFGQTPKKEVEQIQLTEADMERINKAAEAEIVAEKAAAKAEADLKALQHKQWASKWKFITHGADKDTASWYYKDVRYKDGDAEVWLKVVPTNPARIAGKSKWLRGYHHTLEFTIFHCEDKRTSVERSVLYNATDKVLESFSSRTYRKPIVPDSVMEALWEHFCK